jgi:hypothetical protein
MKKPINQSIYREKVRPSQQLDTHNSLDMSSFGICQVSPQGFSLSFAGHVLVECSCDGKMRTLEGHQDRYHLGLILSLTWYKEEPNDFNPPSTIHYPPSTQAWMEGGKESNQRDAKVQILTPAAPSACINCLMLMSTSFASSTQASYR